MERPAVNPNSVQFGLFEVDLQARELRKAGVKIKLNDQPFQVLTVLLERPDCDTTGDHSFRTSTVRR
jgi:DNA-binding response OmpR family regulator